MEKKLYVVGNKVDIPDCAKMSRHDTEGVLLFVGKMNYEPNVVAVSAFVELVLPKLVDIYPALQFQIVGACPDARVLKLGTNKNVTVTGFVETVEPYFQHATIVVAPMLTGAGIQNKIIQAMSYGCCVVTTPIGAEGLSIEHDEIAVWADMKEMAEGIAVLLNNRTRREEMGALARQYVIDNLSVNVVSEQFWRFMEGANS